MGRPGWRSSCPLAALVFAVTVLAVKAWPAIRVNGWYFLYGTDLDLRQRLRRHRAHRRRRPPHGRAVRRLGHHLGHPGRPRSSPSSSPCPLSIGAAFALTERMPRWISRPLGFTIEILAGIPSVVIGLWGILTFGPWLAKHVYPIIADNMPDVPVLRYFRNPVGQRRGPAHRGHRARPHDRPHHHLDHPRPVPAGAPAPQGGGVGARHDRLGGGQQGDPALGALGHHRRHRARPGPGARARPSPSP